MPFRERLANLHSGQKQKLVFLVVVELWCLAMLRWGIVYDGRPIWRIVAGISFIAVAMAWGAWQAWQELRVWVPEAPDLDANDSVE